MNTGNLRLGTALVGCIGALAASAWAMNAAEAGTKFTYHAYQFASEEGWRVRGGGNLGATRFEGRRLEYDFTKGASHISLTVPDRVMLGKPERLRLRVNGAIKGHPVRVQLRTHFMTFEKVAGEFGGEGEQELVFDAPPGHDWQWFGGENDGKIHGPLRLAEIRFEAGNAPDAGKLELIRLSVEGTCPSNRLCLLVAGTRSAAEAKVFTAEMRGVSSQPLNGVLKWVIRDWDKNSLTQGEQKVSIPPGGERAQVEIPVPAFAASLKFAEAEFQLEIPGQTTSPAQAYWLAPHTPHGDTALRPESPFGMGVYLNRFRGADQEAVAKAARDAGVKWSREDFGWGQIEREPGKFDWAFHDRLVDVARANGITVYAIVLGFPSWAKAYTSEGVDQYAAFLRHLVKHFQGRIQQWEIWNEPNIFFWQGPKELYAELLIKSYQAIKETDPTAEVLGLSTAGIDDQFIKQMLEKRTPFDILTIHPYRKTLEDAAFIADLKKVSDLVKLPDGRRRPVWLTEMGWATHVPHHVLGQDFAPNSQRTQAELLARTYLCSIVSGVEPRTFWYNFRNDGDDPVYFEHNMGIMTRDLRPKPAYIAFATLARVLQGLRFAGPATVAAAPEGTFVYRFTPAENAEGFGPAAPGVAEVIAVWNPSRLAAVTLPVQGSHAIRVNAVGEERPLGVVNGETRVTAPAGQAVYVQVLR